MAFTRFFKLYYCVDNHNVQRVKVTILGCDMQAVLVQYTCQMSSNCFKCYLSVDVLSANFRSGND